MSITIDDMKMPKSCIACPFEHNGDCYGGKPKRIMDIEDFKGSRHPDCPLIEAEPIKHGRWSENGRGGIMTNLQWFRTADIFDIAEELNDHIDCPRPNMQTDKCTQFDGCIECWADWLMQERKESKE